MNKQSSIEWLFDQMAQLCEDYDNGEINYTNYVNRVKEAKAKAKEMHKQEIIEAWEDGRGSFPTRNEEEYYNETFNENNCEHEWVVSQDSFDLSCYCNKCKKFA